MNPGSMLRDEERRCISLQCAVDLVKAGAVTTSTILKTAIVFEEYIKRGVDIS